MMILALMFLHLVTVSAAPTQKEVECRDQYSHCPEWSKAGYCNRSGYKTYMTLMCSYSCNTCKGQAKDQGEEDETSGSGVEDNQPNDLTDIRETNEIDQDSASANEPISNAEVETEIQGDSESRREGKGANQVEEMKIEQRKDETLELKDTPKQPNKHQSKGFFKEIKGRQAVKQEPAEQPRRIVTLDRDPPGVQEVTFHDNTDDEVNPRSTISIRPKDKLPVNYQLLSEPKEQNRKITQQQDEDVSASGMLDGSGESVDVEKKTANPQSEEMKDIAGDIKTGSKIFEAYISDPESVSGCSSGFGCFSGNGEQIQSEKNDEAVELEPRSKIAMVPKSIKVHTVPGFTRSHRKNEEKSSSKEVASLSGKDLKDDMQRNDEVTKRDDIARAESVTNPNTKDSITKQKSSEKRKSEKSAKSDGSPKVVKQKSVRNQPFGSGAGVNDDIQGQKVHVDEEESIRVAPESDTFSNSGKEDSSKSTTPKEVQHGAKSEEKNINVNEQEDTSTAKSESPDKDEEEAKNKAENEELDEKKEKMKGTNKSTPSKEVQHGAKSDKKTKNINEQEDTSTAKSESPDKDEEESKNKTENEGFNEKKEKMKDTTEKSESPTENQIEAKVDKEINGKKKDLNSEDVTKSTPKKNQNVKSDEENEEGNEEEEEMKDSTSKSEKDDKDDTDLNEQKEDTNKHNEDIKGNSSGSSTEIKYSIRNIDDASGNEANIDEKIENSVKRPADTEDGNIEDALFSKEVEVNEDKGSGVGSGEPENSNEDLSSPKARQRITSMEQLMKDEKLTVEKVKAVPAKTRTNVPQAEEAKEDFTDPDLGKGKKVKLILDQHYYKPYSNEDSMAYEMLALDLKKEVERAVGNQAIVSQISFSEIRKPGKFPRFSRVMAKFILHGDSKALHEAVRKGKVGDMMVEKHFFWSS